MFDTRDRRTDEPTAGAAGNLPGEEEAPVRDVCVEIYHITSGVGAAGSVEKRDKSSRTNSKLKLTSGLRVSEYFVVGQLLREISAVALFRCQFADV